MASPETLQIDVINAVWSGASGAATDIDEPIGSPDTAYYGPGPKNDAADFGFGASEVVDADIVTNISFNMIYRDDGTAGNLFVDVELLIGGVSQGTTQIAVTGSDTTYSDINNAGWNVDRTATEMDGMELRLTPVNTGMPGTNAGFLETANAIVTFTTPVRTITQEKFGWHLDGTESGAAFVYPDTFENVGVVRNPFDIAADRDLLLRFQLQESGGLGGAGTDDWKLRYRKNGGAKADVTTTSNDVRVWTGSALTDGSATTNRLSAGDGSHVASEQEEANGIIENWDLTANNFGEPLFAIQLQQGDLTSGDVLEFFVEYDGGGGYAVLDAYDQVPIIHVTTGPVIRGITTARDGGFNDIVVVDTPAGTIEGDLLVVQAMIDNSGGSDSWGAQSGWNEIYDSDLQTVLLGAWYRNAPASPPATFTFTAAILATLEDDSYICYRIDGHDAADPIDVNSINNSGADTDPVSTGVTTTGTDRLVLSMSAQPCSDLSDDITPATGSLTWAASNAPDGSGLGSNSQGSVVGGHSIKASADATGNASHSNSFTTGSNGWQAVMVAVKVAAPPGGATPFYYNQVTELQGNA